MLKQFLLELDIRTEFGDVGHFFFSRDREVYNYQFNS